MAHEWFVSSLISPPKPNAWGAIVQNTSVIYEITRFSVSSLTFSIARKNGRFENFSGQVDIDHGVTAADHTATSAVTANFHNLDAGRSR